MSLIRLSGPKFTQPTKRNLSGVERTSTSVLGKGRQQVPEPSKATLGQGAGSLGEWNQTKIAPLEAVIGVMKNLGGEEIGRLDGGSHW